MKDFERALAALAVHFDKKLTNELIDSYLFALEEYDENQLISAAKELIKGKYFPRAHDFISRLEGPVLNVEDLANEAWAKVLAFAWGDAGTPVDALVEPAMSGVCDWYMIKHGDEKSVKNYGFGFRANYRMLLERKKPDLIEAPEELKQLVGKVGKIK